MNASWPVATIKQLWSNHRRQVVIGLVVSLAVLSTVLAIVQIKSAEKKQITQDQVSEAAHQLFLTAAQNFLALETKANSYEAQGVDITPVGLKLPSIKEQLFAQKDLEAVIALIKDADTQLDQLRDQKLAADKAAADLAAHQGTLAGKVTTSSSPLGAATITLSMGSAQAATTTANTSGSYSLAVAEGSYSLIASKSGYETFRQSGVVIKAQQTTTLDIALTKSTPAPAATTTSTDSTSNSTYEHKTISTSNGSFVIDLLTLKLGAIKVKTDTADDNDCADNCPVKALASYVKDNGGFAGINGTYFCPTDYSSCNGQVNSFFWKIKNSRLGKMINAGNGLGENEPFLTFNASGTATYYSRWIDAPSSVYAGINCGPRLIENGVKVLTDGSMDDKQRTVKSNRGALGLKGQTLYAVVAHSATVPDMVAILQAINVDFALNLDGGGSSAIYYNGSYKAGPGRSLPNAVVFTGN